jgi:diadenosine tetraphosphate (Ap4A) HIT family hydrolase
MAERPTYCRTQPTAAQHSERCEGTSASAMTDYDNLKLLEAEHWNWYLHPNQGYLGRVVLALRRTSEGSFADLTVQEWKSLKNTIEQYEIVISNLFNPDRFNYTQMGNEWPKLHVHAIPRYVEARRWNGIEFRDRRWGKNPSPKFESPLTLNQTYDLAQWFRERIESQF